MPDSDDWSSGCFYAALGAVFGPIVAWGSWYVITSLNWPSGEAAVGRAMLFWMALPVVGVTGLVVGPVAGLLIGLFGAQVGSAFYALTDRIFSRFRR